MIALDTNVLVRYMVRDESACTAESPGIVSLIVLAELVWVLGQGYRYRRPQIAAALRRMFAAEDLRVERSDLAWQALNLYEEGMADFSDYLIALSGRDEKAEVTCTFDRRAASCPLFRLVI